MLRATLESSRNFRRGPHVRNVIASLRLVVALLGVTSVTATFFDTASREAINPFNFFGFFTMQSNILLALVLGITAIVSLTGRTQSPDLQLLRGCATAYIVVVGLVYNTLLAGLPGGLTLEWANNQLHVGLPISAVLDWAIIGDRGPLPWNRLAIVTVYPIAWIFVVLVRGATDGWVPYPFLDPATGYGAVAIYCVVIAASTVLVAAVIWALSRGQLLRVPGRVRG
jgi:hypothetical protein